MSELKPCPFCGGKADYYIGGNGYLQCTCCIATIPYEYGLSYEDGKMQAIAKWNRRYQEQNEPLTLDQLREMDGEPVKIDEDGEYQYGLVSLSGNCFTNDEVITLCNGNFYQFSDIDGNIKIYPIAYRRKPESEGRR